MFEFYPIFIGIALGGLNARPVWGLRTGFALVLCVGLCGVAATVLSGEYRQSWGFALVDIGEVALAASVSAALVRRLPLARPQRRRSAVAGR